MHAPLTHWLRLLWGQAPPLAFDSDCAYIAAGAIHLPPAHTHSQWQQHAAGAAHAATHLIYSPQRFDGAGLGPIARVLMALLEDARVEALAVRELPGLARLWRPLHTATPDSGVGFAGLAVRLARSLCDPAYDDPDPWVRKGRSLCFLDAELSMPALCTSAELRVAATRLGHDIGQMRLQFNGKAALPLPAYRDDHRWMWAADALTTAPPPSIASAQPDPDAPDEPSADESSFTQHPEWDRLIGRLRPDWCRVVESIAPDAPVLTTDDTDTTQGTAQETARRLIGAVRDLTRRSARPVHSESGEFFDLDALVNWKLGRRLRSPASSRVYRRPRDVAARTSLWLLIDQSASTAGASLHAAAQSALALSLALQARGIHFGVAAFNSNGRHAVHWRTVKSFAQAPDAAMVGRLQALSSAGSTRLGAVLRHAAQRLATQRGAQRWVLLLSDGSPYDIDVHDPLYLPEDARRAVQGALRHGVHMACLVFEPDSRTEAARIFGSNGAVRVHGPKDLPGALRRLLA
jgi:nitric oxide reductase NorD protein